MVYMVYYRSKRYFLAQSILFLFITIVFSIFIIPVGVLYALLIKGTVVLTGIDFKRDFQEFFVMGIYLSLLFVILSFL